MLYALIVAKIMNVVMVMFMIVTVMMTIIIITTIIIIIIMTITTVSPPPLTYLDMERYLTICAAVLIGDAANK